MSAVSARAARGAKIGQHRPDAEERAMHDWAAELGRQVGRGELPMQEALLHVRAMPGPPGARLQFDARAPLHPVWVADLPEGRTAICGRHVRLAWTMRDAAEQMQLLLPVQEAAARKAVGPALSRGATPGQVFAVAQATAPDLDGAELREIVDQEAAWWLRWREDRGALAGAVA